MLQNCRKYKVLVFIVLIFSVNLVKAQSNSKIQQQFDKAMQFYNLRDYDSAKNEIEKIRKKNPRFVDAILLLSDIYHDLKSSDLEISTLETAIEYSKNPLIYLRLGKAYHSTGEYEKALVNYERYLDNQELSESRTAEINRDILSCRFAIDAVKHPVDFNPLRLSDSVNSNTHEYWPSVSLDRSRLVFTRLVHQASGLPQEDFFISEADSGGWRKAIPITGINTNENEGAQALSPNGRLLFFTACNRPEGFGSCDIYYSVYNGNNWGIPKNAGGTVNSSGWDAQPSVTSDNRFLYFSSNRAGGRGKKDIWRTELLEIQENGILRWGIPKNLGDSINSPGDEISPFIHPNNKSLYFGSDFYPGMGGMDLFYAEIKWDGTFTQHKNIGYPINTFSNEQGLNISADGTTAYFASAREPRFGLDIYAFQLPPEVRPDPVSYVKAKITDNETGAILQAGIELINLSSDSLVYRKEKADENGEVLLCLPLNANYAFNVSEKGYLFYSRSFQLNELKTVGKPVNIDIRLDKIKPGAEMNLYNIYFETDSFRILPPSEPELQKLVLFFKNNHGLNVEIQGHTDNTGTPQHNLELSWHRAQSVVDYLVSGGIEASRLKSKGYGETKPVASNENEEGKRLNRRTTVKIGAF